MSTTASHDHAEGARAAADRAARGAFLRSRLASFLAMAPLGVWTIGHLANNLSAFKGADAWESAVTQYSSPFAQLVTGIIVLLPIVLHTVWGIGRLLTSRPNNIRYGFYANLKYALQRLSAVGVLFFLGAHIWLAMLHPRLQEGHAESFADIAHEMHFHKPTLIVYLLGTLGVAYHLANGAQSFCMAWGIVDSQKALKRLEWIAMLFFVILLAMSWGVIYALYSAAA
jgi:succinate dehydrogenase / fumarate reductase cytochrome b subunit